MENQERFVTGELETIFFENSKNFYKVILIKVHEENILYSEEEIVVTGSFGDLQAGMVYQFIGQVVDHPKYGVQFKAERYGQVQPSSKEGLVRYLSGPSFTGIGEKTAEKIVDHLGEGAIDKILADPDVLDAVRGIPKKHKDNMVNVLKESQGTEKTFVRLAELGFSDTMSSKIMTTYRDETLTQLEENPYQLIEDIPSFGFKRADQLAQQLGLALDSPERLQGALFYALQNQIYSNGDTYVNQDLLADQTMELLSQNGRPSFEIQILYLTLEDMAKVGKVVLDENRVYMASLYLAEEDIVSHSSRLVDTRYHPDYEGIDLDKEIDELEEELGMSYGASQRAAIKEALTSQLFILTGGPGTGKTTVLNGIVTLYAKLNDFTLDTEEFDGEVYPIALAAPTGRAAKRMSESTNLPASTIHRLLGLTADDDIENDGDLGFNLEQDLLIVDEMSMVDTWLAAKLFQAIPSYMQVILVGDQDQLPSVGPGQVFSDLIHSDVIPKRELTDIYRQDEGSTIVEMAHAMKAGNLPIDFTTNKADYSFFPADINNVAEYIKKIVGIAIKKGYTANDIQILAPMYRGQAGINRLNELLQNLFNPNSKGELDEVTHFERTFREGDKVLQLVNKAEHNVFNGDIGFIEMIVYANENEDKVDQLIVRFDGNRVTYLRSDWNQLTLAYCCSIHKSQGSEYPIVIMPIVSQYSRMLKRNLIYTGITRSQKWLIICGEAQAFLRAVETPDDFRQTTLKDKLMAHSGKDNTKPNNKAKNLLPEEKPEVQVENYYLTPELVASGQIDPMIGMEGIDPYSL